VDGKSAHDLGRLDIISDEQSRGDEPVFFGLRGHESEPSVILLHPLVYSERLARGPRGVGDV